MAKIEITVLMRAGVNTVVSATNAVLYHLLGSKPAFEKQKMHAQRILAIQQHLHKIDASKDLSAQTIPCSLQAEPNQWETVRTGATASLQVTLMSRATKDV